MEEFVSHKGYLEEDIWSNLDTMRDRGYAEEAVDIISNYLNHKYGLEVADAFLVGSAGGYDLSHNADSSFIRYKESGDKHDNMATDLDMVVVLENPEDHPGAEKPKVTELHEPFYHDEENSRWEEDELDEFIECALMPYFDSDQEPPRSMDHLFYSSENGYEAQRRDVKQRLRAQFDKERRMPQNDLLDGPMNLLYPQIEVNPRFQYRDTFVNKLLGALGELNAPKNEREGIIFPSVDGTADDKKPSQFIGTFMKGHTLINGDAPKPIIPEMEYGDILDIDAEIYDKSQSASEILNQITGSEDFLSLDYDIDERLDNYISEMSLRYLINTAVSIAQGYEGVEDKLKSRVDFKQDTMNENFEIGRVERTLQSTEEFGAYVRRKLSEDEHEEESSQGTLDVGVDAEQEPEDLEPAPLEGNLIEQVSRNEVMQESVEFIKGVLNGESSHVEDSIEDAVNVNSPEQASEMFSGEREKFGYSGEQPADRERAREKTSQQTLDTGTEQVMDPGKAVAVRKAERILQQHPDIDTFDRSDGSRAVKIGKLELNPSLEKFVEDSADRIAGKMLGSK